jgi:hypothetical protein
MPFNTTNFPSNFSNLRGIPMIASTSVEVTATNVIIGIPKRAFRGLADSGVFAFRLTQEIPAGGATLPVVFSSNEFLQTLTVVGGTTATGAQITPTGIYLIWYDKCAGTMQLLTVAP